jgi:hypothetical protein
MAEKSKAASRRPQHSNKSAKKATQRLAVALRRTVLALKDPNLPLEVRLLFGFDFERGSGVRFDVEDLQRKQAATAVIANTALKPPTRTDPVKRYAAHAAAVLLVAHGRPLNLTRKGAFCKLAAILYSDPKADLFRHCHAVKAAKLDSNRV